MTATLDRTDSQLAGLLAGVLANPGDDLPRLVFADAVEESGQVERAEGIRRHVHAGTGHEEFTTEIVFVHSRGFVSEVRCTLSVWMARGTRLVEEHPIDRVAITDREPTFVDLGEGLGFWHFWWETTFGGDHTEYESRESALDALSARCLAWAK